MPRRKKTTWLPPDYFRNKPQKCWMHLMLGVVE
jgi:hypothetical protein